MIIKNIKNVDVSYISPEQLENEAYIKQYLSIAKYSGIERLRYMNSIVTQRIKLITHYSKSAILLIDDILNNNVNIEKKLATKSLLRHNRESILSTIEILENKIIDIGYYDHLLEGNYIEILTSYSLLSEFLSDFTNTILFRNYNIGERVISTINSKIPKQYKDIFKNIFKLEEVFFYNMNEYAESKLKQINYKGIHNGNNSMVYSESIGFKKGIDVKKSILEKHFIYSGPNIKVATIDISKFFNSISSSKFIQKNIFNDFFKILISYDHRSPNVTKNILWLSQTVNNRLTYEDYELSFNEMEFLIRYADRDVKLEPCGVLISFMAQLFNFTVSYLTHNGKLPTGASYSPILSNTFMLIPDIEITKSINRFLDAHTVPDKRINVTRYADDITLSGFPSVINMDLIKNIESVLNSYGLYIKYSKTKFYDPNKSRANIMGLTFKALNSSFYSFDEVNKYSIITNSKYRKEIMDIINNNPDVNNFNLKEIGKVNYYIKSAMSMVDLSFNLNLSSKSESFNKRLRPIDFNDFKNNNTFSGDYSLLNEIRGLDIFGIDDKLSYKDIIHRLKNSKVCAPLENNHVIEFNDLRCDIYNGSIDIANAFLYDASRNEEKRSDLLNDKIKFTLFKYLKASMFLSKYFINDGFNMLDKNKCNIQYRATDGDGGVVLRLTFSNNPSWTHGKFNMSNLSSEKFFDLVFTKEILDSIQIGRV